MINWLDIDFERTIREYDYTIHAQQKMNRIVYSDAFENMDAQMILDALLREMHMVPFCNYLKRYIYERANISADYREVPDLTYRKIIMNAFKENCSPYTLTPTTKNPGEIIRGWLIQKSVRRSAIFSLGFGLRMSESEVSDFLTKVILEEDFDFQNPQEVVYWYCYHHRLPYPDALKILSDYEKMEAKKHNKDKELRWEEIIDRKNYEKKNQKYLYEYLSNLKNKQIHETLKQTAYDEYVKLYEKCRRIIARIYNEEKDNIREKVYNSEDISPADIEKMICNGIPMNERGNLKKASASLLFEQFQDKRMSRQRINYILNKKSPVDRFDLITLLFFIYAEEIEPDWPTERHEKYVHEINEILKKCRMMEIYPTNPYEAFILMCIISEDPMSVYSDVWELSFQEKLEEKLHIDEM